MIAVIFEVQPAAGQAAVYLQRAEALREWLVQQPGLVSIERFQSLTEDGKLLSLSFWRDEDAVRAWRTQPQHRQAQHDGRERLFSGYRIRVAQVLRDYGLTDRSQAP